MRLIGLLPTGMMIMLHTALQDRLIDACSSALGIEDWEVCCTEEVGCSTLQRVQHCRVELS